MPRITDQKAIRFGKSMIETVDMAFGPKLLQKALKAKGAKSKPGHAQFFTKFDSRAIDDALSSFGIGKKKLIVGCAGYGGNMLRSARDAGYRVAFTDINPKWVELAKRGEKIANTGKKQSVAPMKGFAMDLTTPHINDRKVSAVISFEPSPMVTQPVRTILPNLGAQNGVVLISKKGGMFDPMMEKSWLNKRNELIGAMKEYGVQMRYKEEGKLSFVHFKIPERRKKRYLFDRECYESLKLRNEPVGSIAKRLNVPEKTVQRSIAKYVDFMKTR